jgi:hypothetical protein
VKGLVLLAALLPLPAHADLYRWVDPQTGSVKLSSTPPPWYGDPEKQRGAPAVEVVPYRARGGAPAPETKPAVGVAALEAGAELTRLDPAGAQRRRAQEAAALARFGERK